MASNTEDLEPLRALLREELQSFWEQAASASWRRKLLEEEAVQFEQPRSSSVKPCEVSELDQSRLPRILASSQRGGAKLESAEASSGIGLESIRVSAGRCSEDSSHPAERAAGRNQRVSAGRCSEDSNQPKSRPASARSGTHCSLPLVSRTVNSGNYWIQHESTRSVDEPSASSCESSPLWQGLVGACIMLSAVVAGVETELSVQATAYKWLLLSLEVCLCFIFMVDVLLVSWPRGVKFIVDHGRVQIGNLLDSILVLLSLFDVTMNLLSMFFHLSSNALVRALAMLRVCRLIRLTRLLRNSEGFVRLLKGISSAFKGLFHVLVLLFIIVYCMSVLFIGLTNHPDNSNIEDLSRPHFNSIWYSSLWLFAAITNGASWMDLAHTLQQSSASVESTVAIIVLVAYIFCMCTAFLNLAAGVFIDAALTGVKEARMVSLQKSVDHFADRIFADRSTISFDEFEQRLSERGVDKCLQELDITASDCIQLFMLLDYSDLGVVNQDEFISGCVRMNGEARSVDLACVAFLQQKLLLESKLTCEKLELLLHERNANTRFEPPETLGDDLKI